jgi:hypothetical protein
MNKKRVIKYRASEEENSIMITFYHYYKRFEAECYPTRANKEYKIKQGDKITITIEGKSK